MRRLRHVQETAHLRASFSDVYPEEPVKLRRGQRRGAAACLTAWALDRDGYAPIPRELLPIRTQTIMARGGHDEQAWLRADLDILKELLCIWTHFWLSE